MDVAAALCARAAGPSVRPALPWSGSCLARRTSLALREGNFSGDRVFSSPPRRGQGWVCANNLNCRFFSEEAFALSGSFFSDPTEHPVV